MFRIIAWDAEHELRIFVAAETTSFPRWILPHRGPPQFHAALDAATEALNREIERVQPTNLIETSELVGPARVARLNSDEGTNAQSIVMRQVIIELPRDGMLEAILQMREAPGGSRAE